MRSLHLLLLRFVPSALRCFLSFLLLFTLLMVIKEFKNINVHNWKKMSRPAWLSQLSSFSSQSKPKRIPGTNDKCLKKLFNTTLLIIAFGAASEYESIPLFEMLYKKTFVNRLYCGNLPLMNQTEINVQVVDTRYGAFLYDCLTEVMKAHKNYTGYLFSGEEVLLNYWNLAGLDLERIWEDDSIQQGPTLYEQSGVGWEWWQSPWGVRAMEKVYEYLIELNYYDNRKSKFMEGNWSPRWDAGQALNAWLWNGRGEFSCYWTNKSVTYIPRSFADLFLNISLHFRHSGVRHGIALPSLTRLITLQEENQKLTSVEINSINKHDFLSERQTLTNASVRYHLISINSNRKERRVILNDLRLKEYAVGKFLEYSSC